MAQLLNVYIGLTCVLVIIISNVLSHSTSDATLRFNTMKQWRIQDFPNGGALFCHKWGGAHPVFG